jgi:hypothetical protein
MSQIALSKKSTDGALVIPLRLVIRTPEARWPVALSANPNTSPVTVPLEESQEKSNINVAFAAPIHPVNAITPKIFVTFLNIPISFYKLNLESRAQKESRAYNQAIIAPYK